MSFQPFPSIEGFQHLVKKIGIHFPDQKPVIIFSCKVKLDGTNAAIRKEGNQLFFQSRSKDISPQDDNFGFAAWATKNLEFISKSGSDVIYYGEWAGKNISNHDTACGREERKFYPFAYRIGSQSGTWSELYLDWGMISREFPETAIVDQQNALLVDFNLEASIEAASKVINRMVADCEKQDPFMHFHFDVDGPGEGFVFYPQIAFLNGEEVKLPGEEGEFWFKAKGTLHRVAAEKSAAPTQIFKAEGIQAFVDYFVTEARCLQGLQVLGGVRDRKLTGQFVNWITKELEKEAQEELRAAGLVTADVLNAVTTKARAWWLSS